jgi:hypothetical protein
MLWEVIFMLVVLKIPVVYLCAVVWWAIKAEPQPLTGVAVRTASDPPPGCDWRRRMRLRPTRPRGGRPAGGPFVGSRRVAAVRMHARRAVRA